MLNYNELITSRPDNPTRLLIFWGGQRWDCKCGYGEEPVIANCNLHRAEGEGVWSLPLKVDEAEQLAERLKVSRYYLAIDRSNGRLTCIWWKERVGWVDEARDESKTGLEVLTGYDLFQWVACPLVTSRHTGCRPPLDGWIAWRAEWTFGGWVFDDRRLVLGGMYGRWDLDDMPHQLIELPCERGIGLLHRSTCLQENQLGYRGGGWVGCGPKDRYCQVWKK